MDDKTFIENMVKLDSNSNENNKTKILNVAENLMANKGFNGVSLREITGAANVNPASINYYFRSKMGLFYAVMLRRAMPINEERKQRFAQCREKQEKGQLTIEDVLRAFIEPTLGTDDTGTQAYRKLIGRMSDSPVPEIRGIIHDLFHDISIEFITLLRSFLPELEEEELFSRLACVYGSMLYLFSNNGRLERLTDAQLNLDRLDGALRYIIPFLSQGLSMPPLKE
jgi:AcrR family transcriptional regulator